MNSAELADGLASLNGWAGNGAGISRSYQAPEFLAGIAMVVDVARTAEDMDHHPDIDVRWRTVRFACSTHTAGAVTALDLELARAIDAAAAAHGAV